MKSPYKYHKWPIFAFTMVGVFAVIFIFSILISKGETIGLLRIISSLPVVLLFTGFGWAIAYSNGSILHQPVKDGVNPDTLVPSHSYWLNGETEVNYIDKNPYTGKLKFYVYGWNNLVDPEDYTELFPGEVKEYLSYFQLYYS